MNAADDPLESYRAILREAIELKASAQQALAAEQARYEALTQRVPWAVILISPEGCYAEINPYFANLLGVDAAAIVDKPVGTLGEADQWVDAILGDHANEQVEVSLQVKGDERRFVLIRFKHRRDGYTSVLALDQTERVLALEEARRQAARADAANAAKSHFLAVMSHEIRTPLNGVLGVASLLADTRLETAQVEMVETIRSSGSSLLMLINDILDLAKIEAGGIELEKKPFSPAEVLREIVALFQAQASIKGMEIELIEHGTLPEHLVSDPLRIRQIACNLVSNAIKFTADGSIRLHAGTTTRDHQTWLEIAVEDGGIGIEADKVERLFEAFTQADSSTTRRFGGTGLGLNITKGIVDLMQGSIEVDSEVGRGSRFTVRVPVDIACGATNLAEAPSLEDCRQRLAGQKVLVVEDNAVNRRVAQGYLERVGARVVCARDGREAIDILEEQSHPFDIVLMDMEMPIMDGIEATQAIRQGKGGQPCVPIIALTANAMIDQRSLCLEAGMTDFLAKPVRASQLYGVLARHLVQDHANEPEAAAG